VKKSDGGIDDDTETKPDSSLFIKDIGGKLTIVLVYVDDLILTGDLTEEI
jgi:hypothetical protein